MTAAECRALYEKCAWDIFAIECQALEREFQLRRCRASRRSDQTNCELDFNEEGRNHEQNSEIEESFNVDPFDTQSV